ncbi:MAG: penicillin acylase family protein [Pyrinomonadaceae bacterium]|nr:penicillin acylase family protein [Pyrinomonadaceae bacterium]
MRNLSIARIIRSAGGLALGLVLLAPYSIARSQDRSTRAPSRNRPVNQISRQLPKESSARLAKMVIIYRDTYGVPHVFGRTDASTVFGFAYAQAQDNFWRVEENFISALGRLSEVHGEETLDEDRLNHALEIPRLAREEYARLDRQCGRCAMPSPRVLTTSSRGTQRSVRGCSRE